MCMLKVPCKLDKFNRWCCQQISLFASTSSWIGLPCGSICMVSWGNLKCPVKVKSFPKIPDPYPNPNYEKTLQVSSGTDCSPGVLSKLQPFPHGTLWGTFCPCAQFMTPWLFTRYGWLTAHPGVFCWHCNCGLMYFRGHALHMYQHRGHRCDRGRQ